jgi:hypothetical protein
VTLPLSRQIGYVRHALNTFPEGDPVRSGLQDTLVTLEWLQANVDVIKAAYRLLKHSAVASIFETFVGSEFKELPDVREATDTVRSGP